MLDNKFGGLTLDSRMIVNYYESEEEMKSFICGEGVVDNYTTGPFPQWVCLVQIDSGYDYDDVEIHSVKDLLKSSSKLKRLMMDCTIIH